MEVVYASADPDVVLASLRLVLLLVCLCRPGPFKDTKKRLASFSSSLGVCFTGRVSASDASRAIKGLLEWMNSRIAVDDIIVYDDDVCFP